jgi:hypothetical protein
MRFCFGQDLGQSLLVMIESNLKIRRPGVRKETDCETHLPKAKRRQNLSADPLQGINIVVSLAIRDYRSVKPKSG